MMSPFLQMVNFISLDVLNPLYTRYRMYSYSSTETFSYFMIVVAWVQLCKTAYSMLNTENIRPGPTTLNVAGGAQIEIDYWEERFTLPLYNFNP